MKINESTWKELKPLIWIFVVIILSIALLAYAILGIDSDETNIEPSIDETTELDETVKEEQGETIDIEKGRYFASTLPFAGEPVLLGFSFEQLMIIISVYLLFNHRKIFN